MTIYPDLTPLELCVYDGEQVDDSPQLVVSLARSSIAWLLRGLDELKQPEVWSGDETTVKSAVEYIHDLAGRLLAEVFVVDAFGPWVVDWCMAQGTGTKTLFRAVVAAQMGNAYVYQLSPADADVIFSVRVYLVPGSYRLVANTYKGANCGKGRFSFVGPATITLAEEDYYSSSAVYNHPVIESFDVSVAGEYSWKWTVTGRNGLSSDYYLAFERVTLIRKV